MRIGVLSESSAADKNPAIVEALVGRGHEIINIGMKSPDAVPSLSYLDISFIAASLLNLDIVDYIVGGCGTGQGFCIAINMFPGVACGHILSPLDAWLFARINAGNAVSLSMNQGYGWASEVQLKFIFDRLFEGEMGQGFPAHRRELQKTSRQALSRMSEATHKSFQEIVECMEPEIIKNCMENEIFYDLIKTASDDCLTAKIMMEIALKSS